MKWVVITKIFFLSILLGILLNACIKKYDAPPIYSGTNLKANSSIKSLYDSHITGNNEKFVDNEIITGIVTANDANDNFYKTVIIQDSTAAISIRLDGFGLSAKYPLGMRMIIKLNGMWMGEYGGMLQLGGGVDRSDPLFTELVPVPAALFSKHFLTVGMDILPDPLEVSYNQLQDSLHSRLIKLNNIEFAVTDTAKYFGDAINKLTTSHSLKFCGGGTVYLRTSGFASFASVKTPNGSGSITGIYSEFGSQKQLMIRDTSDVEFTQSRCVYNGPSVIFYEDFEQHSPDQPLFISQWSNFAESGKQLYQIQSFQNNRVASITALGTNETSVVSWLILPAIQLNNSIGEQLSFLTRDAFDNGAVLQILLSNNYDGKGQPWKAKWASLNATIAKGAIGGISSVFTKSGNINLSNYAGLVHIAFKYTGSDTGPLASRKNTNYWVDDVKITAQ
ncbi:DUF5689 domain-containing protein [Sediminibacterium sp.]|uniref:DUF5689 domain-containing protein n=1 Tax=Sediminibacterium sp. TaxID=1917865 RepID=UPI0025CF00CD|nr:DUF5689 domain-containing protein [Sediminibacterium sp.]MBT9484514.1 choice-of-anchor J domain-containing protein [Sediminibacterium sp.]